MKDFILEISTWVFVCALLVAISSLRVAICQDLHPGASAIACFIQ